MSPRLRIALFLATSPLAGAGCASSATPPAAMFEPGPHRGFVRPIAGESGFVEVVTEPAKGAAPALKFRLAVYFLNSDRTESLQPVPADVRLEVNWPDASPRQVLDLAPAPAVGDPAGAAKFVSQPIESDASPSGTVSAKLGDRTVAAAL